MKILVILLILISPSVWAQKVIKKTIKFETAKKYCEANDATQKKFYKEICPPYFEQKQAQTVLEIDPIVGDLKNVKKPKNRISLMGSYQVLGFSKGVDAEVEYRFNDFSVGAFYQQHDISSIERYSVITGSAYGLSAHYYVTSLREELKTKSMSVSALVNAGFGDFQTIDQDLPAYFFIGLGLDCFYPVVSRDYRFGLYGKVSVDHIYESSIGFLHLGGSMSLGLKFDF